MYSRLFCITFLLVTVSKGFSQSGDVSNLLKISLVNPGISYEVKLGKLQTICVHTFLKTSVHVEGKSFILIPYNITTTFFFDPAMSLQFRQYYLTRKQRDGNRNHLLNNMNYIGLYEEMFFTRKPLYQKVSSRRAYNRVALVWGTQQNITRHLSFNIDLGYGYLFPVKPFYNTNGEKKEETLRETPLVQLTLALLLGTKGK
jgi:hypothetical protein